MTDNGEPKFQADGTHAVPDLPIKPLWQVEKEAILSAIAQLNGDKLLAAARLGIAKSTLYSRLRQYARSEYQKTYRSR
jgi:transcriptional regulator of acetoin/glycerol metabolism